MSIFMVPIYLQLLGVEVYGILGLFASLTAAIALLDMGFGQTITKEVSRLAIGVDSYTKIAILIKTFEIYYWVSGLIIGMLIISISPLILRYWVVAPAINPNDIQILLIIMAITIIVQWPNTVYGSALTGLQEQLAINCLRIALVITQNIGAILALSFIGPTLENFFLWQMIMSLLGTAIFSYVLRVKIKNTTLKFKAHVNWHILKETWKYSAGISGISITTFFLTQSDKIILIGVIPINIYGYYIIATNVVNALAGLVAPISEVFFPKFVRDINCKDQDRLMNLYHLAAQLIAIIIYPIFLTIAIFSIPLVGAWLQSPESVSNIAPLVTLLIVGALLNSVIVLPYLIRLAEGRPRIIVIANIIALLLLVPLTIFLTKKYEGVGAASVWIILNLGYLFILLPFLFKNSLSGEYLKWLVRDVIIPTASVLMVSSIFYEFMPLHLSRIQTILYVGLSYLVSIALLAFILGSVRQIISDEIKEKYYAR